MSVGNRRKDGDSDQAQQYRWVLKPERTQIKGKLVPRQERGV
jgi:hypothetical protein